MSDTETQTHVWGNTVEVNVTVPQPEPEPEKSIWRRMLDGFDEKINDIFFGLGDTAQAGVMAAGAAPSMLYGALSGNDALGNVAAGLNGVGGDMDGSAMGMAAQAPAPNVIQLPAAAMKVVENLRFNDSLSFAMADVDRDILGTGAKHGVLALRGDIQQPQVMAL